MFCWKCGEENPDGARFCIKCGAALKKEPETNEAQRKTTGSSKKKVIIALAAIAAAVIVLIVGVSFFVRDAIKASIDTIITSEKETHTASLEDVKNAKDTVSAEDVKNEKDTALDKALMNAKAGDVIKFGTYEQDNDLSNGAEPIEWKVVGTRDGHTLLLSKYALDCKKYNAEWTDITWENCTLRSWLNKEFFNTAFSASDKKRIVTAHNENPDSYELYSTSSHKSGAKGGNATDDKVFLLSWTEARDYLDAKLFKGANTIFNYNSKLSCKPTAFAKAQGVRTYNPVDSPSDAVDCCYWFLRSPGKVQDNAIFVQADGTIMNYTYENPGADGVRPAILID